MLFYVYVKKGYEYTVFKKNFLQFFVRTDIIIELFITILNLFKEKILGGHTSIIFIILRQTNLESKSVFASISGSGNPDTY
jgi:hypothetical protein